MKYDRMDVAVGFLVLTFIVGTVFGMGALTKKAKTIDVDPLYTDVEKLDGLGAQSPVFLSGYQIGRVDDIQPVVERNGKLHFKLRLNIKWTTDQGTYLPLNDGMRARIMPPPIAVFGSGMIALEQVGPMGKALKPGDAVTSITTMALVDQMQHLTDTLTLDVRRTLASARQLLAGADKAIAEATTTARTANEVAIQTRDQLPMLIKSLNTELALVDTTIRRVSDVSPAAMAALDSVRRLVGDSRVTMARLNTLVDRHEPAVTSVMASLDTTSLLLQNFVRQLSEKPLRALTGVSVPKELQRGPTDVRQAGTQRP